MPKSPCYLGVKSMNRMPKTYPRAVCLAVLIAVSVLPALVRSVDYNVGVKVGDRMKYGEITTT